MEYICIIPISFAAPQFILIFERWKTAGDSNLFNNSPFPPDFFAICRSWACMEIPTGLGEYERCSYTYERCSYYLQYLPLRYLLSKSAFGAVLQAAHRDSAKGCQASF